MISNVLSILGVIALLIALRVQLGALWYAGAVCFAMAGLLDLTQLATGFTFMDKPFAPVRDIFESVSYGAVACAAALTSTIVGHQVNINRGVVVGP